MKATMRRAAERVAPSALNAHRARLVQRELAGFEPRRVTHRYGGTELTLEFRDGLAEAWYDHDWDVPPELTGLPEGLVFDLGAHQGVVALMAAHTASHVVAVEADPHNALMAEVNVRLNRVENVTVVHAAAGRVEGETMFHAGLNGHIDRHGGEQVPMVTVDSLARRYGHPDAVLVDVEGHEQAVLEGAPETLERGTVWSIEVHGNRAQRRCNGSRQGVVGLLSGHALEVSEGGGYRPYSELPPGRFWLAARPR